MLDVDLLKTFVAIYESGSFLAASDVVGRTPSAVSLQVRRLEDQIGAPLFLRGVAGVPGVAPTPQGEKLLPHARRILATHEDALDAFGRQRGESHLLLGISADYGQTLLPLLLRELAATHPDVTVEVVTGPSSDIAAQTAEGRIDLSFVGEGEGLGDSPVIYRERCVWASGGDAHRRDPVPLALPQRECRYRRWALDKLDAVDRRHRIAYTAHSICALQAVVRGGLAVTVAAESALVPGMIEIGDAEGFPPLPDVEVRVMRSRARDGALARDVEALLVAKFAADAVPRRAA